MTSPKVRRSTISLAICCSRIVLRNIATHALSAVALQEEAEEEEEEEQQKEEMQQEEEVEEEEVVVAVAVAGVVAVIPSSK